MADSAPEVSEETKKQAETHKEAANKFFKEQHYEQAVTEYTKAIELNGSAVYYSNRAFAHLKLENYGYAKEDASTAIKLDPKYIKGYYRRGSTLLCLAKYKEALKDFKMVAKIVPNDKDAKAKLKACEKEVRKQAFEEAIQHESTELPSETLEVDDIEVTDYNGPRWEEGELTGELVGKMVDYMKDQKLIHKKYVFKILLAAKEILVNLPTLVDVDIPDNNEITVCGDTHGQFYDLCNIFSMNGFPSAENPYLFNGDFVDRGSFSFEVVFTLLAYKVAFPNHLHLSRGNHETKNMNKIYGFEGEVQSKYSELMMKLFTEIFQYLPLAHCLNKKVFVTHGGLFSRDGVKLDEIREINRFCEPPDEGLMTECLWSDPQPAPGRGVSKRGVGVAFGPDVTEDFIKTNGLDLVVRSHECKDEGYEVHHNGKCITIFSAPNYCDQMGNKGAFIRFKGSDMKPKFTSYGHVAHPPVRPMAYANQGSLMQLLGAA